MLDCWRGKGTDISSYANMKFPISIFKRSNKDLLTIVKTIYKCHMPGQVAYMVF